MNKVKEDPTMRNVRKAKEVVERLQGEPLPNIKPCKCGDFPRVKTNGASYVLLFCRTCGYNSGPYLNNTLSDIIRLWNESDRDREKQEAAVAAFDSMMEYCEETRGTEREDQPLPRRFFSFFKRKKS